MSETVASEIEERFWAKVNKNAERGCWEWTASTSAGGYGSYHVNGKHRQAHRFAYELTHGEVPEGLVLDHICRNRACVNPDHLEPVTFRENVLRGVSPSALQARRTHCTRGHLLEGENIFESYAKAGRRKCRACASERLVCEKCGVSVRRDYLREHTRVFHGGPPTAHEESRKEQRRVRRNELARARYARRKAGPWLPVGGENDDR